MNVKIELTEEEVELLNGCIKVIELDMEFDDVYSYFDDDRADYNSGGNWHCAHTWKDRNGAKINTLLNKLLDNSITVKSDTTHTKTAQVLGFVDRALREEDSENIDLIVNETNKHLVVQYHSDNNSYEMADTGITLEEVNREELIEGLDEENVGYCF